MFSEVLQYVPLPDYSKADVAEEERARINTGHRYTVWLDKSDTDYLCLRKVLICYFICHHICFREVHSENLHHKLNALHQRFYQLLSHYSWTDQQKPTRCCPHTGDFPRDTGYCDFTCGTRSSLHIAPSLTLLL